MPKLTLILRKAYGGPYIAMCSRISALIRFLPCRRGDRGAGPDGAAVHIFKKEIDESADPAATRGEKMRNTRQASPSLQGGGEGVCR